MSNNKYIINEDSLTGIADAVRNKLGTGEPTIDPQTGDIIYPEDKGYYLKYMYPVQWTITRDSDTWSGTGTSYAIVANINETQMLRVCNGVRPVYVKIDVVLDNAYDGIVVENSLTNWSTSNHIVTLPTSGQFLCKYSYYHSSGGYSSGAYYQKTIPPVTFSFLDENQRTIISENASYIADATFYGKNFPQESISGSIPFTINDIQNKITNYLSAVNTVQTFSFDGYYHKDTTQPFVNLSSVFNSNQDLLNRLYNFCVSGLPGTLLIGADGHPVSMRKEGVSLPSFLRSGVGGWDTTKVATAYNNDQVFRYHYRDPNASSNEGDPQLAYIYIPPTPSCYIIFCLNEVIGYQLSGYGQNNKMIMYRRAQ